MIPITASYVVNMCLCCVCVCVCVHAHVCTHTHTQMMIVKYTHPWYTSVWLWCHVFSIAISHLQPRHL